ERLRADLDRHVRVGDEVVEPVGIRRRAALRGEDRDGVGRQALVGDRVDALGAGFRALVMEEEKRSDLEVAPDASLVRPELVDHLLIPVRHLLATIPAANQSASPAALRFPQTHTYGGDLVSTWSNHPDELQAEVAGWPRKSTGKTQMRRTISHSLPNFG